MKWLLLQAESNVGGAEQIQRGAAFNVAPLQFAVRIDVDFMAAAQQVLKPSKAEPAALLRKLFMVEIPVRPEKS